MKPKFYIDPLHEGPAAFARVRPYAEHALEVSGDALHAPPVLDVADYRMAAIWTPGGGELSIWNQPQGTLSGDFLVKKIDTNRRILVLNAAGLEQIKATSPTSFPVAMAPLIYEDRIKRAILDDTLSGSSELSAAATNHVRLSGQAGLEAKASNPIDLRGSGTLTALPANQASLTGASTLTALSANQATLTGASTMIAVPANQATLTGAGTLSALPANQTTLTGASTIAASSSQLNGTYSEVDGDMQATWVVA